MPFSDEGDDEEEEEEEEEESRVLKFEGIKSFDFLSASRASS